MLQIVGEVLRDLEGDMEEEGRTLPTSPLAQIITLTVKSVPNLGLLPFHAITGLIIVIS